MSCEHKELPSAKVDEKCRWRANDLGCHDIDGENAVQRRKFQNINRKFRTTAK
jgi:hypothetical protein